MRINNCIDCGEYKYLVKHGKCRSCISSEKIYFGTDENAKDIYFEKNQMNKNINISGVTGTGRTTMALNLCKQFKNNNEYSILYFNFKDKLQSKKFDSENITLGKSTMIDLFNTISDKKDKNYLKEIDTTSYAYTEIILNNCELTVSPKDYRILAEIIAYLFDAEDMSFSDLNKCVSNLNYRNSIINDASKQLKNNSINKILSYEFDKEFKKYINNLSKNFPNTKNKISLFNIIENNKKVIFNFESNITNILSALSVKKIYKYLELQNTTNKYKPIFVFDGFEMLRNYTNQLETMYRHSRHLNMSFINIFEYPNLINPSIINNVQINILFKLNDKKSITNIFKLNNYKNVYNLNNYQYIIKKQNKTYKNCVFNK